MSLNDTAPHSDFHNVILALDGIAVLIVPAVFLKILPVVATTFTVIWLGMQMWTWIINKKWKRRDG